MPLSPPVTNSETNATAYNSAVVKRICPCQSVVSQLNVLIADGMAMIIVEIVKVAPRMGFIPLTNMWCPHTRKLKNPIEAIESTMAMYPKMGLRENVEMTSETMPIGPRIKMYTSGCPK